MVTDGPGKVERRLAAILAADIAGYSALMGANETQTVQDLKAHQAIVLPMVGEEGGRIIDTAGDGILAEFPSVVNAVACAVKIQSAMAERNATVEPSRQMRFRIGINLGDVIHDGIRVYGDGVNIAARLESVADPGGICVSEKVFVEVQSKLDVAFEDIGLRTLKNIARPVRVYRAHLRGTIAKTPRASAYAALRASFLSIPISSVPRRAAAALIVVLILTGAALSWWSFGKRPTSSFQSTRASIAVLPLVSLAAEGTPDYFADGLTEDIISALGRFRDLSVIARGAVFTYKGKATSPAEIGRELKVRYIVEGSVRRSADRVRVSVILTDTTQSAVLWSDKYDAYLKDVLSLQDQITRRITGALAVKLSSLELASSKTKPVVNLEAYDLVLRGRELLRHLTRLSNAEARQLFERAIELDPTYAPAYVGLGRVNRHSVQQGWSDDPSGTLKRAGALARKALVLDESSPGAHALLGQVLLQFGDQETALNEVRRAITLNASDAEAYAGLIQVLLVRGEVQEAIASGEALMEFQPDLTAPDTFYLATAYVLSDRSQDAIRVLQQSLQRNKDEPNTNIVLTAAYASAGRKADANEQAKLVQHRFPWFSREEFGALLQQPRQREKLRLLLKDAGL